MAKKGGSMMLFSAPEILKRQKILNASKSQITRRVSLHDVVDTFDDDENLTVRLFFDMRKEWKKELKASKERFHERWENMTTNTAKFDDFLFIRPLGCGAFGQVHLVKHLTENDHKYHYAIKILNKEKIISSKQIEHTMNEKKIQSAIDFEFLLALIYTFKSNSHLFMVLEYADGGEMFGFINVLGKFTEETAKFCLAQVILAMEYLHALDILHRDLKPENTLICADGYLKLADFGFAKIVKTRTYTLCGTPQYFAPECLIMKGYGKSVDWWAVGILTYEMTAGYPPFDDKNPTVMYEKIIDGKYKTPDHFSKDLIDFLKNIIELDLTKRYGCLKNGVDQIKLHRWLREVNWNGILKKKLKVPNEILNCLRNKIAENQSPNEKIHELELKENETVLYETEFENF